MDNHSSNCPTKGEVRRFWFDHHNVEGNGDVNIVLPNENDVLFPLGSVQVKSKWTWTIMVDVVHVVNEIGVRKDDRALLIILHMSLIIDELKKVWCPCRQKLYHV
jgi:hypothetical protein